METLQQKVIKVTIKLNGKDSVFSSEDNTNKLSTDMLRVDASITYGSGNITPVANINIYGLTIENMTPIMRIQWNTLGAMLNTIRIEVGNKNDLVLTTAYEGNITFATISILGNTTTCLQISSTMAIIEALTPREPQTYTKGQDGAKIIQDICGEMGYYFENNGASHIYADSQTFEGSYLNRIQKIANDCDFDLYTEQNYISICARNGFRNIPIPIISPDTGLIGYPAPDIQGINFVCRYNPLVRFGGIVRIQDSIMPTANGDWRVYGLTANLETNTPQGRWQMQVSAVSRSSKDVAIKK